MNLEDIAKELHVSKAYISMIETGKRSLDYEMAIQMAGLFDVRPDDVFFEDIAKTLS
ncbi:MAG: helix-turn-helix transcriptional regulator [Coprobacillus sp.]|nr:helix-turn-helix transcriptional regulator [Coprobacillus sp.]